MNGTSTDFAGSWAVFWGAVSGSMGNLPVLLGVIGMLMVVGAIFGWIFQRRKGGGGTGKFILTLVIGAIIAGPQVIIPAILKVIDLASAALVSLINLAG